MTKYDATATREAWLIRAVEVFRPLFVQVGYPLPAIVRVSVGWGSTGARQENAQVLGVTYARACTADRVNEVFMTPEDADTASMLETLLHELIHVATDCGFAVGEGKMENPHGKTFAEIATRLGFNGPMTQTPASVELQAELITIAAELGEYPGAKLELPSRNPAEIPVGPDGKPVRPVKFSSGPGGGTSQGTRMIKLSCDHQYVDGEIGELTICGYTVRITRKWINVAVPMCPVHGWPMTEG